MAKGDHKFEAKPTGSTVGGYARPRLQVGFDPEVMNVIAKWAAYHNRSVTAEVRILVSEALSRRTR